MADPIARALKRIEGCISARQLRDPRTKILADTVIGSDEMVLRTLFNVRDDLRAAVSAEIDQQEGVE